MEKELFTLRRLEAAVERHGRILEELVDAIHEVDFSGDFVQTNIRVIEQATTPTVPTR